jgi:hypothetical protein
MRVLFFSFFQVFSICFEYFFSYKGLCDYRGCQGNSGPLPTTDSAASGTVSNVVTAPTTTAYVAPTFTPEPEYDAICCKGQVDIALVCVSHTAMKYCYENKFAIWPAVHCQPVLVCYNGRCEWPGTHPAFTPCTGEGPASYTTPAMAMTTPAVATPVSFNPDCSNIPDYVSVCVDNAILGYCINRGNFFIIINSKGACRSLGNVNSQENNS